MARRQPTNTNIRTGQTLNPNVQAAQYSAVVDTASKSKADNFLSQLSTAQKGLDMIMQQAGKTQQEAAASLQAQEQAKVDEANQKLKEEQLKQEVLTAKIAAKSEEYSLASAMQSAADREDRLRRQAEADAEKARKKAEAEEKKRLEEMRKQAESDYWDAKFGGYSVESFMNSDDPVVKSYAHTQRLNEAVKIANMYADQQVAADPANAHLRGEYARKELQRQVTSMGIDRTVIDGADQEKAFSAIMTELDTGNEAKYTYDAKVQAAKEKQDLLINIKEQESALNNLAEEGNYTEYAKRSKQLIYTKLEDGDKTPEDHIASQMKILKADVELGRIPKDQAIMLVDSLVEEFKTSPLLSLAIDELKGASKEISNITQEENQAVKAAKAAISSRLGEIPSTPKEDMTPETLRIREETEMEQEEAFVKEFGEQYRPEFRKALAEKNAKDNREFRQQERANVEADTQLKFKEVFDKTTEGYKKSTKNLNNRLLNADTIEDRLDLASGYQTRVLNDVNQKHLNADGIFIPVEPGDTEALDKNIIAAQSLVKKYSGNTDFFNKVLDNSPKLKTLIFEEASYRAQKGIPPTAELTSYQKQELAEKLSPVAKTKAELDLMEPEVKEAITSVMDQIKDNVGIDSEELKFTGFWKPFSKIPEIGIEIPVMTAQVEQMLVDELSGSMNTNGNIGDPQANLAKALVSLDGFARHEGVAIPLKVEQGGYENVMTYTKSKSLFLQAVAKDPVVKQNIVDIFKGRKAEDVNVVYSSWDNIVKVQYEDSNGVLQTKDIGVYTNKILQDAYDNSFVQAAVLSGPQDTKQERLNELKGIKAY